MNSKPLSKNELEVKSCLETMIKFLGVESATVDLVENEHKRKTFEVHTKLQEDRGKVIGRDGRNVNSLHTILNAFAKQRGVIFSGIHLNDD